MDRNVTIIEETIAFYVALRKESVDRNDCFRQFLSQSFLSLSARRAWIEMTFPGFGVEIDGSLSARRAWIEIRKGATLSALACCRSPQGERG